MSDTRVEPDSSTHAMGTPALAETPNGHASNVQLIDEHNMPGHTLVRYAMPYCNARCVIVLCAWRA